METQDPYVRQEEPQQKKDASSDKVKEITSYEKRSSVAQALLVCITALYTLFAGLQWNALRETLKVTTRQIELVAEQNALNKETIRARISISGMEIATPIIPNSLIAVNVHFKNTGGSPASSLDVGYAAWQCDTSEISLNCIRQAFSEGDPLARHTGHMGTIEVGEEEFFSVLVDPQSPETIEAVKKGTKIQYIAGAMHYIDAFSNSHTFRFCGYFINQMQLIAHCSTPDTKEQQ
jgi:hypothetical protein